MMLTYNSEIDSSLSIFTEYVFQSGRLFLNILGLLFFALTPVHRLICLFTLFHIGVFESLNERRGEKVRVNVTTIFQGCPALINNDA